MVSSGKFSAMSENRKISQYKETLMPTEGQSGVVKSVFFVVDASSRPHNYTQIVLPSAQIYFLKFLS